MTKYTIDTFVDRLVEEKGLNNLEDEVLSQIKNDLSGRLEDRINAAIVAAIPPENLDELQKTINESDEEKIKEFCGNHIKGFDELIANELMSFRQTYLAL